MRVNKPHSNRTGINHGGLAVAPSTAITELRRAVLSTMLFEDTFYEDGISVVERIKQLVKKVPFEEAAQIALDARTKMKLRHIPLLLTRELIRNHNGRKVGDLIYEVIQRPDELAELLAIYWSEGRTPVASQLKIGIGRAFGKFNEYELAKWNRDGAVKMRDALFISHARPQNSGGRWSKIERKALALHNLSQETLNELRPEGFSAQELTYGKITHGLLKTPDTWEVALSGGADKKKTFERLLLDKKLGALALLRNLRGMAEARVDDQIIRSAILNMNAERVLPFRFISAAKYAPRFEPELEQAMFKCTAELPKLDGHTALLIDHSGSMRSIVSEKSEISRFDAAAALAMVLRETTDQCRVFTFAEECIEVPPRRGFGLLAAVQAVVKPVSTKLGKAVRHVYSVYPECERIIVITDEQSQDRPPHPQGTGYIVDVASYQNGIGYGPWITINGWSEAILEYIRTYEQQ